ncbi:hypothetical protein BKA82DRAFT_8454 [Pisolithus tinctorius]|uniref:Uncharacterized protein n=1 Tax=Pisolithus tinctorius Marx 270 TaxID=870435 RepID=A0A0C3KE30_PISTI|nr:hypothetical protein BKA82DRAFT_8454 [Pisolithus tinctorius]KIO07847.1 hypothetical protein M404DRAFT_8454 [Pisolithus tinctorius Marx 270]
MTGKQQPAVATNLGDPLIEVPRSGVTTQSSWLSLRGHLPTATPTPSLSLASCHREGPVDAQVAPFSLTVVDVLQRKAFCIPSGTVSSLCIMTCTATVFTGNLSRSVSSPIIRVMGADADKRSERDSDGLTQASGLYTGNEYPHKYQYAVSMNTDLLATTPTSCATFQHGPLRHGKKKRASRTPHPRWCILRDRNNKSAKSFSRFGGEYVKGGGELSGKVTTFRFWRTMANGSTIASHVIQNAMASTPYWENNGLERYSPDTRAVIAAESRFTYANFSRNGRRFLRQRDSVTNTERVK